MNAIAAAFLAASIVLPAAAMIVGLGAIGYSALAFDAFPLTDPENRGALRAYRVGIRLYVLGVAGCLLWFVGFLVYNFGR